MMLFSFHQLFRELEARCKSDQLFPCTVVTSIIQRTGALIQQDRVPSAALPRKGRGRSSTGAAGAWGCAQPALGQHMLFPPLPFFLCYAKQVHKPVLTLVWPIIGTSHVATFDGAKNPGLKKWRTGISHARLCWIPLPKVWPGDSSYLSSTRSS